MSLSSSQVVARPAKILLDGMLLEDPVAYEKLEPHQPTKRSIMFFLKRAPDLEVAAMVEKPAEPAMQ